MSNNSEELEKVKVLVVDDHTLFAEGTVSLLSIDPHISVVGIAKNGIECMDIIRNHVPDVVLLDINLPDICGTDLIDKIKKTQPKIKILMLTGQNPKGFVTKSISKGASGFLLKECSAKEMIEAIFRVNNEDVYFSKGLEVFIRHAKNSNNLYSIAEFEKTPSELLTTREIEIMELVAKGLHNKEIASTVGINVRTVDFHVSNLLSKLGVSTRFEAILKWANDDKKILHF